LHARVKRFAFWSAVVLHRFSWRCEYNWVWYKVSNELGCG
jgi:hypothetical protein